MADSVDKLSEATGISRASLLQVWEDVKANSAILAKCPRHDFVSEAPGRFGAKWKCSACGGKVDGTAAHWYMDGLKHAGG